MSDMQTFSEWMVQVWESGEFVDYWPVQVRGEGRRKAVKAAGRVFQGQWKERYNDGSLRWRIGRKLRTYRAPIEPRQTIPTACNTCGGVGHSSDYHLSIAERYSAVSGAR